MLALVFAAIVPRISTLASSVSLCESRGLGRIFIDATHREAELPSVPITRVSFRLHPALPTQRPL
ncbi:hypothetical protein [Burkholderia ambifaria]|uniref:hypothetical protein n=1 Tax=Burkholderia ambifaria TaxID=152480 RepID=UPI00158B71D1|nr:hypothetical protein [Burkholderia ambifaria]